MVPCFPASVVMWLVIGRSTARHDRCTLLPVVTSLDFWQWWHALSPETQRRLSGDPLGAVPPELWREVTHSGVAVLGTFWPSVSEGPDGFRLPHEVAEFVEERAGDNG